MAQRKRVRNIGDIQAAVREIAELAKVDYEGAHTSEDRLHQQVLELVSKGEAGPQEARAALATKRIKFSRYGA